MDIDLKTIPGIVVATIALVHLLKGWLASARTLNRAPVALYVVLVAAGLTWLSHDVLHWLEGDRAQLIAQAVLAALSASGAVEWFRAGAKPLADSATAAETRISRTLPVLLLAGVLGVGVSGCATLNGLGPQASVDARQAKLTEIARAVTQADRVLTIVQTIQQVEIAAHTNGRVSDSAHGTVQQALKEFAGAAEQSLGIAQDLTHDDATRWDAARSVGAVGLELVGRIESYLPPEVAVYLGSLRSGLQLLGFSAP